VRMEQAFAALVAEAGHFSGTDGELDAHGDVIGFANVGNGDVIGLIAHAGGMMLGAIGFGDGVFIVIGGGGRGRGHVRGIIGKVVVVIQFFDTVSSMPGGGHSRYQSSASTMGV